MTDNPETTLQLPEVPEQPDEILEYDNYEDLEKLYARVVSDIIYAGQLLEHTLSLVPVDILTPEIHDGALADVDKCHELLAATQLTVAGHSNDVGDKTVFWKGPIPESQTASAGVILAEYLGYYRAVSEVLAPKIRELVLVINELITEDVKDGQ